MKRFVVVFILGVFGFSSISSATLYTEMFIFDSASNHSPVSTSQLNGLSAQAVFSLDTADPTVMKITLTNTSTDVPLGFDNAAQILTAISFDFGHPGYNGDAMITGGTVVLGPGGASYDMDTMVGPGDDLSGEWGYGNMDGTGLLTNLVSAEKAQTTAFGGANLDGPSNIDGPQGGIVSQSGISTPIIPMGGLGAIGDTVIITLDLSQALTDLNFLYDNGVMVEFGSDAAYLVPEPATMVLLGSGGLLLRKRRV